MRTPAKLTTIVLALTLGLALAACGKKDDTTKDTSSDTPIIVEDTAADEATGSDESESAPDEEEEAEAPVMPSRRAGGPLAFVADDELCSILVTGTGHDDNGFLYGVEITNNSSEAIAVSARDGSFTAGGTPVAASLSAQIEAGETAEATLSLAYTDALPDADAFAQAVVTGELDVAAASDPATPRATYPVSIE